LLEPVSRYSENLILWEGDLLIENFHCGSENGAFKQVVTRYIPKWCDSPDMVVHTTGLGNLTVDVDIS
jgi:proline racemase